MEKLKLYALTFFLIAIFFLFLVSAQGSQGEVNGDLVKCSVDGDCSAGFVGNSFCDEGNVYREYQNGKCGEGYCSLGLESENKIIEYCDDNEELTIDSCIDEGDFSYCSYEVSSCESDFDCGEIREYFLCKDDNVWKAISSSKCFDESCNYDLEKEIFEKCGNGCSEGVCLEGESWFSNYLFLVLFVLGILILGFFIWYYRR